MSIHEREIQVTNEFGLHARPMTQLVKIANCYYSDINIWKGELRVDAKSVISLMLLAATKGTTLRIIGDGPDAVEAVDVLCKFISEVKV